MDTIKPMQICTTHYKSQLKKKQYPFTCPFIRIVTHTISVSLHPCAPLCSCTRSITSLPSQPIPIRPRLSPNNAMQQQRGHRQTSPAAATAQATPSTVTTSPPQRRGLIGEYLARNAAPPPAIFRPSFQAYSPPPALRLAYTHPALLLLNDDEEDEDDDVDDDVEDATEGPNDMQAVTSEQTTIVEASEPSEPLAMEAGSSIQPTSHQERKTPSAECDGGTVVGHNTAILIRTWEQLSVAAAVAQTATGAAAAAVAKGTMITVAAVKRRSVANTTTTFYDSIDNDDEAALDERFAAELGRRVPSTLCDDDDDDFGAESSASLDECGGEEGGGGSRMGEAMADESSLLDRPKIAWSMES